jgi:hypothetical protein
MVALLAAAVSATGQQEPPRSSRATFSSAMYAGHMVVDVRVTAVEDVDWLKRNTVDFWSHNDRGGRLQVHMAPEHYAALLQRGLDHRIVVPDLQVVLEHHRAEIEEQEAKEAMAGTGWFDTYRTFAEMETRLDLLASSYSSVMTASVLGQTVEGRDIHLVELVGTSTPGPVPSIVITGGQHAREWLAHMAVMNMVETLASGYGVDPRITEVLDGVRIYIVPMTNPDGYEHSWITDRLWRKNRNTLAGTCGPAPFTCPLPGSECGWGPGVDLNRNWAWAWGGDPNNADPCGPTYRGPAAFSELETLAVSAFAQGLNPPPAGYLDVHSFSQVILLPWSNAKDPPPFAAIHQDIGQDMADGMLSSHGLTYEVGSGDDLIGYSTFGGSKDWFLGELGALSWSIETRPDGTTSFVQGMVMPVTDIVPTAEENFEALLRLGEYWVDAVWVDFGHTGLEAGTFAAPWNTLAEGVANADPGQVVRLRAGASSETPTISDPLSLEAFDSPVTVGGQ